MYRRAAHMSIAQSFDEENRFHLPPFLSAVVCLALGYNCGSVRLRFAQAFAHVCNFDINKTFLCSEGSLACVLTCS